MPDKVNIAVKNFGLSSDARLRVEKALHTALQKELKEAGIDAASGIFGDGSVKGGIAKAKDIAAGRIRGGG
ncbi:hypothetical protein [Sphingomonas colocasiae]|jgi:hypothetical protein|uniref:Small, acid-soluble spore protein, alpha/beta type n=1 Tax=Sphingomonas colocasiae TaxID=1848973 RepID=A0ABS7PHV4_9SPHN|nr:hypothetical protein [Sphingomonas colocasiae]MBY8820833.1 hypothetical protein [Sphingomonas colocasiae]